MSTDHEDKRDGPDGTGDFIRAMVVRDLESGKYGGRVATRFPPEPNGYLHIGHAKAICLSFGIAQEFDGTCNLRFDDTNPTTENPEFVESIQADIRWLGFAWANLCFASGYFQRFYDYAVDLVRQGKAYVDSSSEEEIREARGTVNEAGTESPYRDRSVEENLDLLQRMKAGEFKDGEHVLRAKIDMAAANMKMRDPLLYRIRHAHHYRTGDEWCIYPMYDYAHCLSDSIEGITHSLCTLEFENNREIYDWVLENLPVARPRPEQTEFARLKLDHTVLSKRKLLRLVGEGHVEGWDDPRMPTLAGYRRRGYRPEAIRKFCDRIGVSKANSVVDVAQLEHSVRDDLNPEVQRVLCVLRPLKVVIENYPQDQTEELDAPYFPRDVPKEGSRSLLFSREIFIEREDFEEDPPKGFFRLAPGREVRLRYGYVIRCESFSKNEAGEITEIRCTYDPETRGGTLPPGRKVKGTIHWVSAQHSVPVEVRLYDRLFEVESPDRAEDVRTVLNPKSLEILTGARLEPSVAAAAVGSRFQFERQGYFYLDPETSSPEHPVYNRIVTLKDTWARLAAQKAAAAPKAAKHQAPKKSASPAGSPKARPAPPRSPELEARGRSYRGELGLSDQEAEALTGAAALADFFDAARAAHPQPKSVAKWVVNELLRELKGRALEDLPFTGADFGDLVALVDGETISGRTGKQVLEKMLAGKGAPGRIVEDHGWAQIADEAQLRQLIEGVLGQFPGQLEQYRSGKASLFGFFVGQVMKASGGRAHPELANRLLRSALG